MLVTNPVTHDPRVRREAESLTRFGYRVEIVGVHFNDEEPAEETLNGARIVRVPHPRLLLLRIKRKYPRLYLILKELYRRARLNRSGDTAIKQDSAERSPFQNGSGKLARLQHDCRTIANLIWLNAALFRRARKVQADIFHAHDLDTLLAAYLVARLTGKKLIYDFHELYTEQFQEGVKSKLWRRFYSGLERILARRADLGMTVCDSIGQHFGREYGLQGVVTVKNVPVYQDYCHSSPERGRERVILYHGLYFRNRGLDQLIESVQYFKRGRLILRGFGDWEEELRALVNAKGLHRKVEFAPPVPMVELVKAAGEADVGVAPFIPVCLNTRFCLPNKLFEYMMAGLAIVGSDLPEMRKVILGHHVGAVFDPHDPREIARVINEVLDDEARLEQMKDNARHAAKTIYNWEIEEGTLLKAYDRLFAA